jgi:hypothetical protein
MSSGFVDVDAAGDAGCVEFCGSGASGNELEEPVETLTG